MGYLPNFQVSHHPSKSSTKNDSSGQKNNSLVSNAAPELPDMPKRSLLPIGQEEQPVKKKEDCIRSTSGTTQLEKGDVCAMQVIVLCVGHVLAVTWVASDMCVGA